MAGIAGVCEELSKTKVVPSSYAASAEQGERAFYHAKVWDSEQRCVSLSSLAQTAAPQTAAPQPNILDDAALGGPLVYAVSESLRVAAYEAAYPPLRRSPRKKKNSTPVAAKGANPFEISARSSKKVALSAGIVSAFIDDSTAVRRLRTLTPAAAKKSLST